MAIPPAVILGSSPRMTARWIAVAPNRRFPGNLGKIYPPLSAIAYADGVLSLEAGSRTDSLGKGRFLVFALRWRG